MHIHLQDKCFKMSYWLVEFYENAVLKDPTTTSYKNFIFKQSGNSPSFNIYPYCLSSNVGIGKDNNGNAYLTTNKREQFSYENP